MHEGRTLVVILCAHRCGSSVTANILQRLGMSLGPFPLIGASKHNKYGHFEAMPLYELDRELQGKSLGYSEDLPESANVLRGVCEREARWEPDIFVPESTVENGKELIRQLIESGPISGFKDPRVPLVWPFWSRVFSSFPDLRIVLLVLIRSPHEIAMSIFRRRKGVCAYRDALDVTAVHFKRISSILEGWKGDYAVVRFDPEVFAEDLRQAAQLCGLVWRDEVFDQVYDSTCKHHSPAGVTHQAQNLFERLGGLRANEHRRESLAQLEQDAAMREDIIRAELAKHQQEIEALRKVQEQAVRLEAELAMIKGSRTWRVREQALAMLRLLPTVR